MRRATLGVFKVVVGTRSYWGLLEGGEGAFGRVLEGEVAGGCWRTGRARCGTFKVVVHGGSYWGYWRRGRAQFGKENVMEVAEDAFT
jgi:hypothetical protein